MDAENRDRSDGPDAVPPEAPGAMPVQSLEKPRQGREYTGFLTGRVTGIVGRLRPVTLSSRFRLRRQP